MNALERRLEKLEEFVSPSPPAKPAKPWEPRRIILWANGSASLRSIDVLEASGELAGAEIVLVHWDVETERQNANELRQYIDRATKRGGNL